MQLGATLSLPAAPPLVTHPCCSPLQGKSPLPPVSSPSRRQLPESPSGGDVKNLAAEGRAELASCCAILSQSRDPTPTPPERPAQFKPSPPRGPRPQATRNKLGQSMRRFRSMEDKVMPSPLPEAAHQQGSPGKHVKDMEKSCSNEESSMSDARRLNSLQGQGISQSVYGSPAGGAAPAPPVVPRLSLLPPSHSRYQGIHSHKLSGVKAWFSSGGNTSGGSSMHGCVGPPSPRPSQGALPPPLLLLHSDALTQHVSRFSSQSSSNCSSSSANVPGPSGLAPPTAPTCASHREAPALQRLPNHIGHVSMPTSTASPRSQPTLLRSGSMHLQSISGLGDRPSIKPEVEGANRYDSSRPQMASPSHAHRIFHKMPPVAEVGSSVDSESTPRTELTPRPELTPRLELTPRQKLTPRPMGPEPPRLLASNTPRSMMPETPRAMAQGIVF